MIKATAKKIIEENVMALATADSDGVPRAIAVGDVKVLSGNALLVADIFMRQTRQNLQQNNRVSLTVWDSEYRGYTITGEAEYFEAGEWLEKAKNFHAGYEVRAAIIVRVMEISELLG